MKHSACRGMLFILIGLLILITHNCVKHREDLKMFREKRILMDTFCTITVVTSSRDMAKDAIDAGFREIERLGYLINYYDPQSELSMINRSAGKHPVKVSPETIDLIEKAIYISRITDGAFDPTIAPVLRLWKFEKRVSDHPIPSQKAIKEALRLVDYRKIRIDHKNSTVFLEESGMEMDLGGIAKGYAADRAVRVIRKKGIPAALVAIAGDIRGYGLNTSGRPWKIGIQNPRPSPDNERPWEDVIATLELTEKAISTSGDYQRYFIKNNRRYHHILDPHTGYPADTDLISVSVIAPEGYLSDSLATAVFVLGVKRGLELLKSLNLSGILITKDMKFHITDDLKNKIDFSIN